MVKNIRKKIIDFIKLGIIIYLFFNLHWIFSEVLSIFNINIDNLNQNMINLVDFTMQIVLVLIIFLIYKDTFINDFKTFKENFSKHLILCLKLVGIFFLIKIGSGLLSYLLGDLLNIKVSVSENQNMIKEMTSTFPFLMLFSASLIAPFIEEATFRLGFRKIIDNKYLFILISGLAFGLIHIFPTDLSIKLALLQSISYVAMGFTLAYFYLKYKNIWYPIFVHLFNNLISVIVLILTLN